LENFLAAVTSAQQSESMPAKVVPTSMAGRDSAEPFMRGVTETGSAPRAARSSRSGQGEQWPSGGERDGLAGEQSGGSVVINPSPKTPRRPHISCTSTLVCDKKGLECGVVDGIGRIGSEMYLRITRSDLAAWWPGLTARRVRLTSEPASSASPTLGPA
jgi:hypothetical protein